METERIDFFARRSHYVDHMAPVWHMLDADRRGAFWVPEPLVPYAEGKGIAAHGLTPKGGAARAADSYPRHAQRSLDARLGEDVAPHGTNPVLVCAYGDLEKAHRASRHRPLIFMEHGCGITFNHPAYAGGAGLRQKVALFLAPNQIVAAKTRMRIPGARQVVIGTPKLDRWAVDAGSSLRSERHAPVVCISFHWDGGHICPEAGNAWKQYHKFLPELVQAGARARRPYKVIGHAHPRFMDRARSAYEDAGIEVVEDFDEVMERADLYVNDCSSTMYEFCVTGRPVIILNSPFFRRNVYFGVRFWDYADVGPQVEQPEELLPAIAEMLEHPARYTEQRQRAVKDLFPYLGYARMMAAHAVGSWQFPVASDQLSAVVERVSA